MLKEYIVKPGETLWSIAQRELGSGTRWLELGRQLGITTKEQARRLPVGAKLAIPEVGISLKGTATGTLETGGGVAPTGQRELVKKEMPTIPIDNLSTFKDLLKRVSERYGQESMAVGLPTTMGTLGVSPEQISGRSLADIVDFVKGQTTPGISDIYKSTVDLLESSRTTGERQLTMMINQNALPQLNDEQLTRLSNMSGMDFDYLMGLRNVQTEEAKKPKSWATVDEPDGKYKLGFDNQGNIVSKIKISGIKPRITTPTSTPTSTPIPTIAENKTDAALLQIKINTEKDPLKLYRDIMADLDVPAGVRQYLKRPTSNEIEEAEERAIEQTQQQNLEKWLVIAEANPEKYKITKSSFTGEVKEIWEKRTKWRQDFLAKDIKVWP